MSILPEEDLADVLDLTPHEPHNFHAGLKASMEMEDMRASEVDVEAFEMGGSSSASQKYAHSSVQDGAEQAEEQLSMLVKVGYGFAEMGLYTISSLQGFYESKFLLEVAGISAFAAGIIMMIGEVFDAFCDPLMGRLSDITETRWGRRRPWLFFGSFPFGIVFFLSWLVPPVNIYLKCVYYAITIVITKISYGAVAVPYTALTPDITDHYNERTKLTMYRMVLGMFGSVFSAFFHQLLVMFIVSKTDNNYKLAYAISGGFFGLMAIICIQITCWTVKERYGLVTIHSKAQGMDGSLKKSTDQADIKPHFAKKFSSVLLQARNNLRDFLLTIRDAARFKAFVLVTLAYVLSWISVNLIQANIYFFIKYVYKQEAAFLIFVLVLQVITMVSLPPWATVSRWIGKKRSYYLASLFYVVPILAFITIQPGQYLLLMNCAILGGIAVAAGLLLPWSMLPDVIELDELQTGMRREGLFYSFFVFFQKVGLGMGIALGTLLLGAAGYESHDDPNDTYQPESVIWTLRAICGPIPGVLIAISVVLIYFFPITRTAHKITSEAVRVQRLNQASFSEDAPSQPAEKEVSESVEIDP